AQQHLVHTGHAASCWLQAPRRASAVPTGGAGEFPDGARERAARWATLSSVPAPRSAHILVRLGGLMTTMAHWLPLLAIAGTGPLEGGSQRTAVSVRCAT